MSKDIFEDILIWDTKKKTVKLKETVKIDIASIEEESIVKEEIDTELDNEIDNGIDKEVDILEPNITGFFIIENDELKRQQKAKRNVKKHKIYKNKEGLILINKDANKFKYFVKYFLKTNGIIRDEFLYIIGLYGVILLCFLFTWDRKTIIAESIKLNAKLSEIIVQLEPKISERQKKTEIETQKIIEDINALQKTNTWTNILVPNKK